MMVEVLYVDNHLLVLNKRAGILTQPTQHEDLSLELLGKQWVKEQYQKPGNVFLHALHRLDRPVSGIVLFARTSKALSRLNEKQRAGSFQKQYHALAEGSFKENSGVLEHFLQRSSYVTKAFSQPCEGSKKAILKFEVLQRIKNRTLLKLTLITGRYHQIRAQLSAIGHPIVGDAKYGSKVSGDRVFLHHSDFAFTHPISEEKIYIHSPPSTNKWFLTPDRKTATQTFMA